MPQQLQSNFTIVEEKIISLVQPCLFGFIFLGFLSPIGWPLINMLQLVTHSLAFKTNIPANLGLLFSKMALPLHFKYAEILQNL